MNNVAVVLITKNAGRLLDRCLASLSNFEEVIIYDNGSTDDTLEICARFENVKVFEGEFLGFGKTKKHAASLASSDWIFSLDADEVMSSKLSEQLLHKSLDPDACYVVRRDNYYRNKHITCCGWYPEYIVRLYNKTRTDFSDAMVHETVNTKGMKQEKLTYPIEHYSFDSVADFLVKIQSYSEIYANEHQGKSDASIFKAFSRGLVAFIKSYFFRKGWSAGFEGFVIAFFHGLGTTVKYLKLHEKNRPR